MFNVIRPDEIPVSLLAKTKYDGQDVYDKLREIFHDKCYLCETKEPQDINVEHFVAHEKDDGKKFDWKNLYLVCSRCNNIKGNRYNNLLDCCKRDVDVYRSLKLLPPFTPYAKRLIIEARVRNADVDSTVELLDKIYNGTISVNKAVTSAFIRARIFERLCRLQGFVVTWYSDESLADEKKVALDKIRMLIGPDAPYSAFMRDVLYEDEKLRFLIDELDC